MVDASSLPEFDDEKDRLDHYWRQVFKIVGDKIGVEQVELIKLVKLLCSLSHG